MKNKKLLIITALITLLPMVFGLILWDRLPDTVATHFGADNEPNGWSGKAFTVFGIPAIMCALHIFCITVTANDPKRKNINDKLISIIYWVIPVISVAVMAFVYGNALGVEINISLILPILMGVLFIILGNYMPKAKQNFTFGVKTPWTLSSEENWNRTNRLGGWVLVILGFLMILNAFLLKPWLLLAEIFAAIAILYGYSFYLHKKGI